MKLRIEHFYCNDGDGWFSIISDETGDIATGLMHESRAAAKDELLELL